MRRRVRSLCQCKIRVTRGGAGHRTRVMVEKHPRRASHHQFRCEHRIGKGTDQRTRGPGGARQSRSQSADAASVRRRSASSCLDKFNSMLRHHFSPNGRISCSNTQALRGCARERGETVATIFRTSCQRTKFEIGDKNGGGAHQQGCGEHEAARGSICPNTRMNSIAKDP